MQMMANMKIVLLMVLICSLGRCCPEELEKANGLEDQSQSLDRRLISAGKNHSEKGSLKDRPFEQNGIKGEELTTDDALNLKNQSKQSISQGRLDRSASSGTVYRDQRKLQSYNQNARSDELCLECKKLARQVSAASSVKLSQLDTSKDLKPVELQSGASNPITLDRSLRLRKKHNRHRRKSHSRRRHHRHHQARSHRHKRHRKQRRHLKLSKFRRTKHSKRSSHHRRRKRSLMLAGPLGLVGGAAPQINDSQIVIHSFSAPPAPEPNLLRAYEGNPVPQNIRPRVKIPPQGFRV